METEERELEIPLEKIYELPPLHIVRYKNLILAIAVNKARWLVLKNEIQFEVLQDIILKKSIGEVLKKYESYSTDVVEVFTQIEATKIETIKLKSNFNNTRLHLHLTNKCNLCCPHCYLSSGTVYKNELSTHEIEDLCRKFKSIGGEIVTLTGGEPTLRKDFLDIIAFISSIGMRIALFTNGTLLNDQIIERLAKCDNDGVQVSIDGYDEDSNSIMRGSGAFKKALQVVDVLVSKKIHVKIAVTAPYEELKNNYSRYIEFSKGLIGKYGDDAIEINYSYTLMPGRKYSKKQIRDFKDEYYKLVDRVVSSIYPNILVESFVANILNNIYDSCGFGALNVMANGDYYFCDRISDVCKSGNIRDISFNKIFESMKLAEYYGKIDNFMPCKECELKYICGGGCRAEHFPDFTKNFDLKGDFSKVGYRKCDMKNKNRIYELMVLTYERFYR